MRTMVAVRLGSMVIVGRTKVGFGPTTTVRTFAIFTLRENKLKSYCATGTWTMRCGICKDMVDGILFYEFMTR
jgi:hypothetical protein